MGTDQTAMTEAPRGQLDIAKDKQQPFRTRLAALRTVMLARADKLSPMMLGGMDAARAISQALSSFEANPKLLDAAAKNPSSLFSAIGLAGSMGWACDGITGQAYLVPFKDKIVLIPGYKGLRDLVERTGQYRVRMESVHDGDEFEFIDGFTPPKHARNRDGQRLFKPVTDVYTIAQSRDGKKEYLVFHMTVEQCIAHRDQYSENWRRYKNEKNPWHEKNPGFRVMCMKCPFLEAVHRGDLPISVEDKRVRVVVDAAVAEHRGLEILSVESTALLAAPDDGEDQDGVIDENPDAGNDPKHAIDPVESSKAAFASCQSVSACGRVYDTYAAMCEEQSQKDAIHAISVERQGEIGTEKSEATSDA